MRIIDAMTFIHCDRVTNFFLLLSSDPLRRLAGRIRPLGGGLLHGPPPAHVVLQDQAPAHAASK